MALNYNTNIRVIFHFKVKLEYFYHMASLEFLSYGITGILEILEYNAISSGDGGC